MEQWNLELIYKNEEELNKDFSNLENDIKSIEALRGTLNTKEGLIKYYDVYGKLDLRLNNLFMYCAMKKDLNQKDPQAMDQYKIMLNKYYDLISRISFADPEILTNNKDEVLEWANDERLVNNKFNLEKLFRMNKYTFDAEKEELLSNYNTALNGYTNLYDALAVMDNYTVKVTLSDGQSLDITNSNYRYYLEILENQDDRRIVFEAVFKYYSLHKNTFANIYNGIMNSEFAEVKARKYDSILQMHLYHNNIPTSVVESLINTTKENLAPLKEYLDIRKKFFKLDNYHTYDRFLNFATSKIKYTYPLCKEMVLDACHSLGEEYYQKAQQALEDGRVSVYSTDGKTTGAYSNSSYEKGAFILLNHTETLNDAFTVAHECGHSIHSLYANEAQSSATSSYEIFVAEVASTFNEQLFLDYMIKHTDDKNEKLVLLQQAIDGLVGTYYRQTLFADYEYQAHKLVEEGTPISADTLSSIMKNLYKEYYDIDLNNEEYKEFVWAYIPHLFHTPFYVYQYATSYSASLAIYDAVKSGVDHALENHINLLKAGGSDYPVNLLKKAGCDLTTKAPFEAVSKRMAELVSELKKTLGYE